MRIWTQLEGKNHIRSHLLDSLYINGHKYQLSSLLFPPSNFPKSLTLSSQTCLMPYKENRCVTAPIQSQTLLLGSGDATAVLDKWQVIFGNGWIQVESHSTFQPNFVNQGLSSFKHKDFSQQHPTVTSAKFFFSLHPLPVAFRAIMAASTDGDHCEDFHVCFRDDLATVSSAH